MLNITPMVRNLLLLNVLVFFGSQFLYDFNTLFALRSLQSPLFQPYQFLTYMFAHGGTWHLIMNMFGLFMFGPLLENHWGSARFLVFYLVCGLGAGFIYSAITYYQMYDLQRAAEAYLSSPSPTGFAAFVKEYLPGAYFQIRDLVIAYKQNPADAVVVAQTKTVVQQIWTTLSTGGSMVGASGAVFGILMAFGMLFPNLELMLLFPPIPMKAKYMVLGYGAYEIYATVFRSAGDNVAHTAHLGGMLFAFIMIKYWQHRGPDYE